MTWWIVLASVGILSSYAFGSSSIDDSFMDYGTFYQKRDSDGKDAANIQMSDAISPCNFECSRESKCTSVKNERENGKCHKVYSNIINSLQDTANEDTWLKDTKGNDYAPPHGAWLEISIIIVPNTDNYVTEFSTMLR